MNAQRIARLALIAAATLLVGSIIMAMVGYLVFVSDPKQGPFDGYRFREVSIGLAPYLLLTGLFFAAWLSRSRGLQMTLIALYAILGLYVTAVGVAAWSYTGNILTLLLYPVILMISLPSFIAMRKQGNP